MRASARSRASGGAYTGRAGSPDAHALVELLDLRSAQKRLTIAQVGVEDLQLMAHPGNVLNLVTCTARETPWIGQNL